MIISYVCFHKIVSSTYGKGSNIWCTGIVALGYTVSCPLWLEWYLISSFQVVCAARGSSCSDYVQAARKLELLSKVGWGQILPVWFLFIFSFSPVFSSSCPMPVSSYKKGEKAGVKMCIHFVNVTPLPTHIFVLSFSKNLSEAVRVWVTYALYATFTDIHILVHFPLIYSIYWCKYKTV